MILITSTGAVLAQDNILANVPLNLTNLFVGVSNNTIEVSTFDGVINSTMDCNGICATFWSGDGKWISNGGITITKECFVAIIETFVSKTGGEKIEMTFDRPMRGNISDEAFGQIWDINF